MLVATWLTAAPGNTPSWSVLTRREREGQRAWGNEGGERKTEMARQQETERPRETKIHTERQRQHIERQRHTERRRTERPPCPNWYRGQ